MSRHLAAVTHRGRLLKVVLGHNRRLQAFFLQVMDEQVEKDGLGLIYTSTDEPWLDWQDVGTVHAKVQELDLVLPRGMVDEVGQDRLRQVGNRVVRHHAGTTQQTVLLDSD